MKATELYDALYDWCKAVLDESATVYRAYQNMPMRSGHILLIDPAPRVDFVRREQGNPCDALHGSLVFRMRGSMTLTEIGGYDYLYELVKNANNALSRKRLNRRDLVLLSTQGPVSVPNIDDASSEWYDEQTLVLTMEWVDMDAVPMDGDPLGTIREVVATEVKEDGTDGDTIDVVDDTVEP